MKPARSLDIRAGFLIPVRHTYKEIFMGAIYTSLVAEQLLGALLFFSITWLIMRKKDGKKLEIGSFWLIAGFMTVTFGAGTVRFISIYIIGGERALNPQGGLGMFFTIALPILLSVAVSAFLRARAKPKAEANPTNA